MNPILCVYLILMWMPGSWASREVPDLYQTSVAVTGQGDEERVAAFKSALTEVIARVSGRKTKPPTIRAEDLIARYHYATVSEGLRLIVTFEPAAIDRLLGKRDIPVWKHRPSTLVWLVIRDADGTLRLAGSDGPSSFQIPLHEGAQRRGIPLVWPLMDLMVNADLPLPENQLRLVAMLREASRGYPVEAVWIGQFAPATSADKNVWKVSWILIRGSAEEQWQTSGTEPATALIAGVDKLTARLAAGIPTLGGGPLVQQQVVPVVVTGVVSLESYAQLCTLLGGLSEVVRFWPTHLDPDGRMSFAVEPRGTATDLATTLSRTGILLMDAVTVDSSTSGDSTLSYRLPHMFKQTKN